MNVHDGARREAGEGDRKGGGDAWMFRGMLRDDGNRMASVRRDDKVKVKRRDKLGESFGRSAPRRLGKRYIEMRGGAKRGKGNGRK